MLPLNIELIHYCLSELAKKSFLKIHRFKDSGNKIKYMYFLTPKGLEEKARITLDFLRRRIREYEEIKRQILELAREVDEERLEDIPSEDVLEVLNGIS